MSSLALRVLLLGLCLSAALANAATQLYYVTGPTSGVVPPGNVVISATTNAAGVIRIVSFRPPDHDWRVRICGSYYGLTYNGSKAPDAASRGTWIVVAGHSLRLKAHIYFVVGMLGVLVMVLLALLWKGKGSINEVV